MIEGSTHDQALTPIANGSPQAFFPREAYSQHLLHSLKAKIAHGKKLFSSLEEEMQILDHNVPTALADGIWLWPLLLPERFVSLIMEAHPAALVVLAHFAALMRGFEVYWWSEGWSESVVDMVVARLEARAYAWVEWRVTCVRDGVDVRGLD